MWPFKRRAPAAAEAAASSNEELEGSARKRPRCTGASEGASSSSAAGADGGAADAAQSGASAGATCLPKELHEVQFELQLMDERCAEEQISVQKKYDTGRRPFFSRRSALLRRVPGFWPAALLGHPSGLVHPQEKEVLQHIVDLDLKENTDRKGSFEVSVQFSADAPFEEKKLVKRVTFLDALTERVDVSKLTASGEAGQALLAAVGGMGTARSVFGWLLSAKASAAPGSPEDFGDVLRRDLWQDPVPYFLAHQDGSSRPAPS